MSRHCRHIPESVQLNPDPQRPWVAPLPVEDGICTLIEATSVFTHLVERQAEFYLDEVARVLAGDGRLVSTWFLFDKDDFPYMQDTQNALYINDRDPTNAVAYDRKWLQAALASRSLMIAQARPPAIRGFHWRLDIVHAGSGIEPVEIPEDLAPPGRRPPPLLRPGADRLGLDGDRFASPATELPRAEPPPPSPLAAELQEAKKYIASLEARVGAMRARPKQRIDAIRASPAPSTQDDDVLGGQRGLLPDRDDVEPLRPVLPHVGVLMEGRVVPVVELLLPAVVTPDRDAVAS